MTDVNWAGRTVMVTGALGFIGSHFVERLAAEGASVIGLHRTDRPLVRAELSALAGDRLRLVRVDLGDEHETRAAFRYLAPRIDAVFHCAALDGNAQYKRQHSAEILDLNVRTTAHLLNCAREFDVDNVLLLSSSEVYCVPGSLPASEEEDVRRSPQHTENGYVLSKIFGEILADHHQRQFATRVFRIRPGNVYGPRDSAVGANTRVIPSMIARAAAGEEIEIWGDGSQTRSFIHAADLVRCALKVVETGKYEVVNVGSAEEVPILELARLVAAALDVPSRVRTDPGRPAGASVRRLDLSRMREVIDFRPRSLRAGLEDTVRWYRDNERPQP
ncbi:NAD-dependent epimerase/dehydratase family protein [Streptomyces phaeochromogenes]|uniref:NAD-dependent epimerase/dehydratase family protein n=1 Tax=Streptomyces phaeochromogenes TaxID=1923 RepID=UPI00367C2FF3